MLLRSVSRFLRANWGIVTASLVWEVVSVFFLPPLEGPPWPGIWGIIGIAALLTQTVPIIITEKLRQYVAPVILYGSAQFRVLLILEDLIGFFTLLSYIALFRYVIRRLRRRRHQ